MTRGRSVFAACVVLIAGACGGRGAPDATRASGYVEATDVQIAAKVPGRVATVAIVEGARVAAGDVIATLETTDTDLAIAKVRAERAQAEAQVRLLRAGARPEEVQQAAAQVAAAKSDASAAEAELAAARTDEVRFQQLVDRRAGTTKQRDDAAARRELAEARVKGAADRIAAAEATLARLRAGARREELDAAEARVRAIDADLATLGQRRADATITAPSAGIVTSRLVEPGELVAVGSPVAVIVDLDRAWVNAYVEEPLVPTIALNQPVTVVADDGHRLPGRVSFIAPRAEFTPRNVQTSAERAKLVYRVKVTVDNREGVLKSGMPVEVVLANGKAE
ncbi:MAG: HlyD family efflux transporter periplasmic adaptor subunit [Acidobacteria bacterium]|nr:HlyD family efflux transporter periplasmic adaptor subunit [Acidobacteriota bacterium]